MTSARAFARRMLPLAIIAGLVVAVVPPLSFGWVDRSARVEQAAIYARQIAAGLREAAHKQPLLWRYNAEKILQATVMHQRQGDIATIAVRDCRGASIFRSRARAATPSRVHGRAQVRRLGRAIATVDVRLDMRKHRRALWRTAALAGPLGLLVGVLLFVFPVRVVRSQALARAQASERLEQAQRALSEANATLTRRVEASVARVRELSRRVAETQDEERRRIARDLHDSLGQAITGLQMDLEIARARPAETDARLAEAVARCAALLAELRDVVRELRPVELSQGGLAEAARAAAERFERQSGVTTYFRSEGDGEAQATPHVAASLLRVLQEALTNVSRHASASEVSVRLSFGEDEISLIVRDDGVGFEVAPDDGDAGFGLRGMRERCELLDGTLEVVSAPGEGCAITAFVPRRG